jgi:hypothetical protein
LFSDVKVPVCCDGSSMLSISSWAISNRLLRVA